MVPSPRFNLGPYSSYVLPTFRGSRLVLMLTPLLLSGIYSCGFKGSDSNSAHTECVDRYSTDECGSFDVEMFFKIDATIECNFFYRCGQADSDAISKESIEECINEAVSQYAEHRALGYCPSSEYDACAVLVCTRDRDCGTLADLDRALSGEIPISEWCEEAGRSPESCTGGRAQLDCEPEGSEW